MAIGIRAEDLRKVYTSPPPTAATGRGFGIRIGGRRRDKQRYEVKALEGLSLEVTPGEIFGLLGPNGAGKSTTVGVLTTRVRPTAGRAWIGPHDVWQEGVTAKRLIGVVPQRPNPDLALTARESLTFHGAYFGVPAAERGKRAQELLERFQLTDRADQLVLGFSGGMLQRLSIARALMHEPQVLFLDEPSAGLDPQTRLLLWDLVRRDNERGTTILLTTHNMEEADALCSRVAIVDHGRLIALGTPQDLKRSIPGGFLVRLHLAGAPAALLASFEKLPGVTEVRTSGDGAVDLYADRGGALVPEIARLSSDAGVEIRDVKISEPSLENLFLHHTGRSLRD
ncbi:MAG TPA: ATP-binding cassette domain-containing protein [Thermoanaerobaculia bacterium]|nr:ATP-binding cassette domain-containing protein [Thermoanaerobaculia bacterium]